jgi:hypothetical protein
MSSLRYPSDGFAGSADAVTFKPVKYNGRSKGPVSGGGYITLYMPETTPTVVNSNMWGRESMGGAGPLGLAKRRAGETVLGDLAAMDLSKGMSDENKQKTIENLKGMFSEIKKDGQAIGKQIGLQMAGGMLSMSPNSIMQQKTGQIYNPNVELIYQGPAFREFGFSFNMIPKSSGDAQIINQIIREFKRYSAPNTSGGGMYEIPYVWEISYLGDAKNFMNKFMAAACTSVSVTDNDGIAYYGAHKDGAPLQTTLTLQFKEVDMVLREHHTGPRGA